MAYSQAELAKIAAEGFAIIDKYFARPKRNGHGRVAPIPPPGNPQMKEAINKSNMPSGFNIPAGQNFRGR
jgi:hypothetical protein